MMMKLKAQIMKKSKNVFLTIAALLTGMPAFAQVNNPGCFESVGNMGSGQITMFVILAVVLGLIVLMLVLLIYLMSFLSSVLGRETGLEFGAGHWCSRFKKKHVSGDEEGEVKGNVLEHHSYDGISELDIFMTPCLQYVFVLTIGFGVVYFINFSVLGWGNTQIK